MNIDPKKKDYVKAAPAERAGEAVFMKEALKYARIAAGKGEVPVGAVIVKDGKVIARGYNRRESARNALMHAEIIAINRACKKLDGWRLSGCDLYVTLEPCPMCAGAIINSRIENVYYGAPDPKAGSMGSVTDMTALGYNFKPYVHGGMMEDECVRLMKDFFRKLRERL
ncbi:MAG: nucleoside deaminase [Ruminococcaceae bacterium]|nr:nucleoside deaminase [Oscillospiraceae bacterium]